jgi:hypothetical protein
MERAGGRAECLKAAAHCKLHGQIAELPLTPHRADGDRSRCIAVYALRRLRLAVAIAPGGKSATGAIPNEVAGEEP